MRTLAADSHEALETPVVCEPVPCKERQLTVSRLPDRLQTSVTRPFRDSGFLEVELSGGEEYKPGTLVKVLTPAVMYLGAVVARVTGSMIVEVDLSTEYTPV